MQLITSFSGDLTVTQTADQQAQTQLQLQHPFLRRQLTAKWEKVDGKLECYWILT